MFINKPLRRPAERLAINKRHVAVPKGQPREAFRGGGSRLESAGRQMDAVDERVHAGVP
jgi:hypothetical protein